MHSNLNLSLILTSLLTLSACSTQQTAPSDRVQACVDNLPNSQLIKKQSVTTGCIVSAVLWKAIGQNNPASLICLAGGGASLLLGKSIAERKCSYRIIEEQIDGEIAHAQKMNTGFIILLAHNTIELSKQKTKVATLLAQQKAGHANLTYTNTIKKGVAEAATKERNLVKTLLKDVAFKRKTLDESNRLNNTDKASDLQKEIKLLYKNIRILREKNKKLFQLENQLSGL